MIDVKSILSRAASWVEPTVVGLLFTYPWSDEVSILTLEEACRKPRSWISIALAAIFVACVSLLAGVFGSSLGSFYFSLVSQIYQRDGIAYLWQPVLVLVIEIAAVLGMAFGTAYWLQRWHDYGSAKWAWFSFVVTAGALTAAMELVLYACSWLFLLFSQIISSASAVFSVIVGICAFLIIFGSLFIFLSRALSKVKLLVHASFYEQYRLPIGLALATIWMCFMLGSIAFQQSLKAIRGDPAKSGPVWKLPVVGMTMIGCDPADKFIVCAFSLVPDDLPDLVAMGRWRSFSGTDNMHAWLAWEVTSEPRATVGTVSIQPKKVLDLMLRAGRDELCAQAAQGSAQLHFQARARGATPPFNERQRLNLVVVNAQTYTEEIKGICR